MKDKTTAALLAFFLGGIGGHKFYLGQTGQGVVYLLMCWTFIPAMIACIEFFVYLLMDEQTFNARYNNMRALPAPQQQQPSPQQMAQNITVNIPDAKQGGGQVDVTDQLERLNELRLSGALSEDEFKTQKQRILAQI